MEVVIVRTRMAGGNLARELGCGRSGIITCYLVEMEMEWEGSDRSSR